MMLCQAGKKDILPSDWFSCLPTLNMSVKPSSKSPYEFVRAVFIEGVARTGLH